LGPVCPVEEQFSFLSSVRTRDLNDQAERMQALFSFVREKSKNTNRGFLRTNQAQETPVEL
jgi:hypothetical protein